MPSPNGHGAKRIRNQIETSNWSGYAVAHFETGITYSEASGSWAIPSIAQPSPGRTGYSASWVGIGGFCENSGCTKVDRSLIQLGTEQDISSNGTTSYGAWYELLPNPPIAIPVQVNPGDGVAASLSHPTTSPLSEHGNASNRGAKKSSQTWMLSFSNLTTGAAWTTTLRYRSSLASAEWIEEAPASGGTTLPLANYTTVTFDQGTVNGSANPSLVQDNGIIMVDPQGQSSNPSVPDSGTDGFSTCSGNGTALTTCTVPAS